jgi:NAD(P)-dependent dehydrogenase (short-subunit alcohol dehydrogenase family)
LSLRPLNISSKQAVEAAKRSPTLKKRTNSSPQDVAEVVRFLCSEEGAFVTGSVIEVAGTT